MANVTDDPTRESRRPEGIATLVVMCPRSAAWGQGIYGLFVSFDVLVDDVVVASGRLPQDVSVPVSQGRHEVRARSWRMRSVPTVIDAANGEVVRLRMKVKAGLIRHSLVLVVDEAAAGATMPWTPSRVRRARDGSLGESPDVSHLDGNRDVIDVRETRRSEEPAGEESRLIDNRQGLTTVTRSLHVTREWSRSVRVGNERLAEGDLEFGAAFGLANAKGHVLARLTQHYELDRSIRQAVDEEITITVPEKTASVLVLRWKTLWQHGVVTVRQGTANAEVPYAVTLGMTFDQVQRPAATKE
jgi:hypothetical protein